MRYAIIENGIVTNTVEADALPENGVLAETTGNIGDSYADGQFTPPVVIPDPERIRLDLVTAVQAHLDATARERGYDGILSLASYAASTHPPFSAEGRAGLDWRDAVWGHCYQVLADVQAGNRAVPSAEELIAELPAMVWPA